MNAILDRYPKRRPPLPAAFREIYQRHYIANRKAEYRTTSLSRRLESWMHRRVAADVSGGERRTTLEIGAGTLNHLAWEGDNTAYDIVEPFRALYEDSPLLGRVRRVFGQMADVPVTERYDRIVSIATFEHLDALPDIVARSALVLADGGVLRVAIPNEGTILWWLGTVVTGAEFRLRYGLDYQILMRHEHVNTAEEIEAVLRWFFADVRVAVLGVSRRLAFYRFLECRRPQRQRAALAAGVTSGGGTEPGRSAA
jgi:SAM-dependent methyltransferase